MKQQPCIKQYVLG